MAIIPLVCACIVSYKLCKSLSLMSTLDGFCLHDDANPTCDAEALRSNFYFSHDTFWQEAVTFGSCTLKIRVLILQTSETEF